MSAIPQGAKNQQKQKKKAKHRRRIDQIQAFTISLQPTAITLAQPRHKPPTRYCNSNGITD